MKELLKALNQRPVATYPIYVAITGSISGGVALSQLMYWFGTGKDKIYKTDKDFEGETGHTAKEMKVVRKHLRKLLFLTITREGVPAKTHYAIDWAVYQSSMHQWSQLRDENGNITRKSIQESTKGADCTTPMVETITENTQENTTESSFVTPIGNDVSQKSVVPSDKELKKMIQMLEVKGIVRHLIVQLEYSDEKFELPTEATKTEWAKDIEKIIRIYGKTPEEIKRVITWIHTGKGSWWIPRIQSGEELHKHFKTLWEQVSQNGQGKLSSKDRIFAEIGVGEVFCIFPDKELNVRIHVCLYGKYNALYDYYRHKYIEKKKAEKMWKHIDEHIDEILAGKKKERSSY